MFEKEDSQRLLSNKNLTDKQRIFHIIVTSALGIFLELLLIRWLDSQVRPLAYVKNLPLIASFLGLGIGYATTNAKRSLIPWAGILLALILASGTLFSGDSWLNTQMGPSGPESNLGVRITQSAAEISGFCAIVMWIFIFTTLSMVPLGQLTGLYMEGLPAISAYMANIFGSLLGVGLSFLLATMSAPPWVNASIGFLLLLLYGQNSSGFRIFAFLAALITCFGMAKMDSYQDCTTVWSPYNKIQISSLPEETTRDGQRFSPGWMLKAQNIFYQKILDLSPATAAKYSDLLSIRNGISEYNYPYQWIRPKEVLVVGAGTGNDVAAALRSGAEHVDAVEIDPVIIRFGRELHPEHPYDDPRVTVITDDARAFLKRPGKSYDLIVFGLLDSHSSFYSSLSGSIRLDNYVYTVESFKQTLKRLKPDGILSLSFYVERKWMIPRFEAMLREAWGQTPYMKRLTPMGYTFLAGDGLKTCGMKEDVRVGLPPEMARQFPEPGPVCRDDWPFIYLEKRTLPPTILWASCLIFLAGIAMVRLFFSNQGGGLDRHFFFLGAGFLLVETKTIAQLALIFGTTWRVSAAAIAGIFFLILGANMVILRTGPLRNGFLYFLLFLSLLMTSFVPVDIALGHGIPGALGMLTLLLLPLFFAALIFASSIGKLKQLSPVLASNIIGAVLGGLLENLSLILGISALGMVSILVYAASYKKK
ncbi:MAG: methyltransferase domain-containing protein [Candidatus Aureabacteria bacterium]|nr:methyltransferase domain-containing protein [Candidatus Auribacterota bacterium]